jgi:L,D-transpeptidase YbiS
MLGTIMGYKRHWFFLLSGFMIGIVLFTLIPVKRSSIPGDGQAIANMSYVDEGYVQKLLSLEEKIRIGWKEIAKLEKQFSRIESRKPYLVVNTSKNEIRLVIDGITVRKAKCSTGSYILLKASEKREWLFRTPKGKFRVTVKFKNPHWYKPDWAYLEEGKPIPSIYSPKRYVPNVLGDFALGFGDGYLVHGTLYKRFLGLPVTHGCVRLGDDDMNLVFNTLTHGSKIYIY